MPRSPRPQSRRAALLEFAILGVLHDGALHGYELRKRLTTALGIFRALSYGSLYPALRALMEAGHISETPELTASGKRPRITYELTAEGKEHFQDLVAASGPDAWDDDDFDVRLAFFSRTEREVRLRILEGRRSRLEERLARIREVSTRNRERMDSYTLALQQHGEERAEREVRWLEELISAERRAALDPGPAAYDLAVPPAPFLTPHHQTQPQQTPPHHKE
ncbi:PadR family transcriptional regulator [Intrasporangium calvum]|uniref:PadR family transcriptional regulator n=1 Tax=Intrasporangium calvum TaxID=53358 RepID=UPI000DF612B6|nr:PadR family transcriptional regulator [Intrasporangium calvum]AXG14912.1 PadR family transcriptional regulator [Intrasporangium calvum]